MDETVMTSTSIVDQYLSHAATAVPRPQPLGLFPLPLGFMLVPAGDDADDARKAMLAGRLPANWPPILRAHELAAAGDRDGALAELRGQTDPVATYNRFVLDPDSVDPDALRLELGEFSLLVDVVLFALGRVETPPRSENVDGEIAAAVLSAEASNEMTDENHQAAVELLDRAAAAAAAISGPLAGTFLGAAGAIYRDIGDARAVSRLNEALSRLDGADGLRVARAEIHLCLAGLLHEQAQQRPELLASAIPHYHSALQLVRRDDAPVLWAGAHAGLATAYLTMPMVEASGQLRLGVAAQSLRSALSVYTREEYPREWASVQLNLANSLVYTPSRHQTENLVEAAEIYEAVLQTRDRATDPLGRARVLANQGNVLAHLGVFDDAKAKLYEARFLFEELGDNDSVRAVRGVLDEIARQGVLSVTDETGQS
jgi:tetratricopeptide (TPR) repeat protein